MPDKMPDPQIYLQAMYEEECDAASREPILRDRHQFFLRRGGGQAAGTPTRAGSQGHAEVEVSEVA
jgi:hypothetical protein